MEQLDFIPTTAAEKRRRPRLAPATPTAQLPMTPARTRLLELVHRFPYSTVQMLAIAYVSTGSGVGSKHVQHELTELHHCGYVRRHWSPAFPSGAGSDPYRYTITTKGGRAGLAPERFDLDRSVILNRLSQKKNYEHFTGLSALHLILALGHLPDDVAGVPPQTWQLGEFRSDHEHQDSRIRVQVAGRPVTLWPDAEAVLHHDNGGRSLWLFEYDRERKSNPRIDLRFRAYLAHFAGPTLERAKRQHQVAGAVVVFVAPNEQQLHRLIERARDVIAHDHPNPRPLFLFWNAEGWYEHRALSRRQAVGTAAEKTRTWTRLQLKDPRKILAEHGVLTVTGKERQLVQPVASGA
jgi:hypothetical protein